MPTLNDSKTLINPIIDAINPISVILYGSIAEKGEGNDIDLIIVTEDDSDINNDNKKLFNCLKPFYKKYSIEPFIIKQSILNEHFRKGSHFLFSAFKNGRLLYMKNSIQEWIRQAGDELAMAVYLFKGDFYKGACFHSQQAIEKYIKSQLLLKGWDLIKIDNIQRLIALCDDYKIKIKINDDDLIFIDSIFRGRYPAEEGLLPLGNPDKNDAERAIKIAEKILAEVV